MAYKIGIFVNISFPVLFFEGMISQSVNERAAAPPIFAWQSHHNHRRSTIMLLPRSYRGGREAEQKESTYQARSESRSGRWYYEHPKFRWGDNQSLNGIDGNKKVKGIKGHVVGKNSFLIAVMVTTACVHDRKAAYLLAKCMKEHCCNIKVILADAGYRGEVASKIKRLSDMRLKPLQAETSQMALNQ